MGRVAFHYCAYCITGLYAAHVAARLRRELKIDVERVRSRYGEFKVLVDGETVIDAGAWGTLGVLPSGRKVVDAVRARLSL
jgi:predicted Rdx family selenoprotein